MGTPKGNKNHLMHGLYARKITPEEAEAVKKISRDLSYEITLLRVFALRILCQLHGKLKYSPQDRELVSLFSRMCQTIGTLSKRQADLNGWTDDDSMLIDSLVKSNSKFWEKA
jgi:hypothetical protein